jgi:hypothetical protein
MVRRGILPEGVEQREIYEALRQTKPVGVMELFGFLRVKVFRKRGYLWHTDDYGLVSCKKVTTAFANYLQNTLRDHANYVAIANFKFHDMGDSNTAEANTQTALSNSRETRVSGTQANNGANIYQSVATITASAGYTVEEHGLFNAATSNTMMDRNLVPNAPVVIAKAISIEFGLYGCVGGYISLPQT